MLFFEGKWIKILEIFNWVKMEGRGGRFHQLLIVRKWMLGLLFAQISVVFTINGIKKKVFNVTLSVYLVNDLFSFWCLASKWLEGGPTCLSFLLTSEAALFLLLWQILGFALTFYLRVQEPPGVLDMCSSSSLGWWRLVGLLQNTTWSRLLSMISGWRKPNWYISV